MLTITFGLMKWLNKVIDKFKLGDEMKPINPTNFGVGSGKLQCTAILNTGIGVETCSIVEQVGGRHYNLASIGTPSRTLVNCFLVSGTPANLGEMNIAVTAYGEGTATHATYVVNGSSASTLTLTAVAAGTGGNAITIALTTGGTAGSETQFLFKFSLAYQQ